MPTDRSPCIVTSNRELRRRYEEMGAGDICVGRLRLKPTEEPLLIDLLQRGVKLIPSALSQLLSRSKSMQAQIFQQVMLPLTAAIHDQHDMLDTVNRYQKHCVGKVVTKLDRKNAGMGIHLWGHVEEVFSHASLGALPYPFVIQPFAEKSRDIRVVMLGDEYEEAYFRDNPHNFRNNLHCGGDSSPCTLRDDQHALCRRVMTRGAFPYAHLDLMVMENGETYLAEINLRGGIRGAKITPSEYQHHVEAIHARLTDHYRLLKTE